MAEKKTKMLFFQPQRIRNFVFGVQKVKHSNILMLYKRYNNSLKGVARCIPVGTEHLLMNAPYNTRIFRRAKILPSLSLI